LGLFPGGSKVKYFSRSKLNGIELGFFFLLSDFFLLGSKNLILNSKNKRRKKLCEKIEGGAKSHQLELEKDFKKPISDHQRNSI
jgi:hypothetical protein